MRFQNTIFHCWNINVVNNIDFKFTVNMIINNNKGFPFGEKVFFIAFQKFDRQLKN